MNTPKVISAQINPRPTAPVNSFHMVYHLKEKIR
jgi:hypothetical protein